MEVAALNKAYDWTMGWLRKRAGGNGAHLPSKMQGVVGVTSSRSSEPSTTLTPTIGPVLSVTI